MSNKQTCDACGHEIIKPIGYTANNIRPHINEIKDFDQFVEFKKYFVRAFEYRYGKTSSLDFLNAFEKMINNHDKSHDIEYIKIWLLNIFCNTSSKEMQFYKFLKNEYSDINETFVELYNKYIRSVDDPLNKNRASRALTALGLKTLLNREKRNGEWKAVVLIRASKDHLSEIFRKNNIV